MSRSASSLMSAQVVKVVTVALAVAALAAPRTASAQNVLQNGTFEGTKAPFAASASGAIGNVFYDPTVDRGGGDGSGSLMLVDDYASATPLVVAQACVTGVQAGQAYYFGADVRFAPGETATGSAQVAFWARATDDCLAPGASLSVLFQNAVTTGDGRGVWLRQEGGTIASSIHVLPPGTKSVRVTVSLNRLSASGDLTAHFDNVLLAPVGKPLCKGKVPTIGGSDAADAIAGTAGDDVIVAFGGDDTISAGEGQDTVCAGDGDDTVNGQGGDDDLLGQAGDDTLRGASGDDKLNGGSGDDALFGNEGADKLVGGAGVDTCAGGGGTPDAATACESTTGVP